MPCQHQPVLAKRRFGIFESYVNQCLKCGKRVGGKIPYHQLSPKQIAGARLWNAKLRSTGRATARSREYQQYMRSPEWRRLRQRILERDAYTCAFCGEPADSVHHLHYRNFGCEREQDVVATCRECNQDQRERSITS